jgi:hypothetical protein
VAMSNFRIQLLREADLPYNKLWLHATLHFRD